MERYVRNHLALFSFSGDNETYTQNAEELTRTLSVIEDKIAHYNKNIDFYCSMTRLDFKNNRDYITLCIKDNKVYLGFYDKEEKKLSFYDNKNYLERKRFVDAISKLESNVIRDITSGLENQKNDLFMKQTIKIWEPVIPLLNKIQEIDKQIHSLPESNQNIIFHSLQYDQYIDSLIEKYENMNDFEFFLAMKSEINPFTQQQNHNIDRNIKEREYER